MVNPTHGGKPREEQSNPVERCAPWLLSEFGSRQWTVQDTSTGGAGPPVSIDWRYRLPDGSVLTDQINEDLLSTAKIYSFNIRSGPHMCTDKASVQVGLTHNLLHIFGWMRLRGLHRLSHLTIADLDEFVKLAPGGVAELLDGPRRLKRTLQAALTDGRIRGPDELSVIGAEALLEMAFLPRELRFQGLVSACIHELQGQARWTRSRWAGEAEDREARSIGRDKEEKVVSEAVRRIIRPLEDLWIMRRQTFPDNIRFQPYALGASKLALKIGRQVSQTPDVPPRQVMFLLDRAVRWVVDYADDLLKLRRRVIEAYAKFGGVRLSLELNQVFDAFEPAIEGEGAPWPLRSMRETAAGAREKLELNAACKMLAVAAFLVIIAFTGRRNIEVAKLTSPCIEGNDAEGYWIETYIAKSLKEKDFTPCPVLVVRAVDVLKKLSAEVRDVSESGDIFVWVVCGSSFDVRRLSNIIKQINEYADYVGVPVLDGGEKWWFTAHQLRRFFAVTYIWRYQFGELEALAHQLRHYNVTMTRRYVQDFDTLRMMAEEDRRLVGSVLLEAALGERSLGGRGGERVTRILGRLKAEARRNVTVVTESRLKTYIDRFVERSQILLKQNPWSYCICPASSMGASRANCRAKGQPREDVVGPDMANARPEVCHGCMYNLTDRAFLPFLEREIASARAISADMRQPELLRAANMERLRQLEQYLSDDFGSEEGESETFT